MSSDLDKDLHAVSLTFSSAIKRAWTEGGVDASVLEQTLSTADHAKVLGPVTSTYARFLDVLNGAYLEHSRRLNRLAPVNRLPEDVLVAILAYVELPDRLSASQVCKQWRLSAINDPRLWTTLDFTSKHNAALVPHLLHRAKQLPLDLRFCCDERRFVAYLQSGSLDNYFPMIETLSITGQSSSVALAFKLRLPSSARLRSLIIDAKLGPLGTELSVAGKAGFPSLQRLRLANTLLRDWPFPALRELVWAPRPSDRLVSEIIQILRDCPALERLCLYGLAYDHTDFDQPPSEHSCTVATKNLRSVSIMGAGLDDVSYSLLSLFRTVAHLLWYESDLLDRPNEAITSIAEPRFVHIRDSVRRGRRMETTLDGQLRDMYLAESYPSEAGDSQVRREVLRVSSVHVTLTPALAARLAVLRIPHACWSLIKPGAVTFPALEELVLFDAELVRPTKKMASCPALHRLVVYFPDSKNTNTTADTFVSRIVSDCTWPIQQLVLVTSDAVMRKKLSARNILGRAAQVQLLERYSPVEDHCPFSTEEIWQDTLPDEDLMLPMLPPLNFS